MEVPRNQPGFIPELAAPQPPAGEGLDPKIASLIEANGGVEALQNRFGFGLPELTQSVKFGSFEGALVEALVPPAVAPGAEPPKVCPLGAIAEGAYQEGGLTAVLQKMDGMKIIDPDFSLTVTPETVQHESLKKNRAQFRG